MVGEASDDAPPRWLEGPSISFAEADAWESILSSTFALKLPVEDEGPIAALVEVRTPKPPPTLAGPVLLHIAPGRPVILASGGECSHFGFPPNEVIGIAISLLDTAGNVAPAPMQLSFRVPSPRPPPVYEARTSTNGFPRAFHRPEPNWPALAIRARFHGDVTGELLVTPDGTVAKVTVKTGNPLLSQPTSDALSMWRFSPIGSSESRTVYFTTHFIISEQDYNPDWSP
jgi:hypothetical protein